ncbi:unnamed protein product [Sphagnum balticum]
MAKRKAGSQTASLREKDSRPLKVRNRPDLLGCRWRATYRWKGLEEIYNFASDRIAIGGLHKKLWGSKVAGVPVGGISGLPCGSPGTKSHLDVASVGSHIVYYKGEGGSKVVAYSRVRAVVRQVSPRLPVALPSTKGASTMHYPLHEGLVLAHVSD